MDVCEKLNMKYNARVFLPESVKGTSEVTQNAQFILSGLRLYSEIDHTYLSIEAQCVSHHYPRWTATIMFL